MRWGARRLPVVAQLLLLLLVVVVVVLLLLLLLTFAVPWYFVVVVAAAVVWFTPTDGTCNAVLVLYDMCRGLCLHVFARRLLWLLWFVVVVGFDVVVVWVTQADGTFNAVLVWYFLCRGLVAILAHVTSVPWCHPCAHADPLIPPLCGWAALGYCSPCTSLLACMPSRRRSTALPRPPAQGS